MSEAVEANHQNTEAKDLKDGTREGIFTKTHRCPECGSMEFIRDHDVGEVFCENCGLVVESEMINMGPEWRAFTPEEKMDKNRVGSPVSQLYSDMSTTFKPSEKGLTPEKRSEFNRLKVRDMQTKYYETRERNISSAASEIGRLSDKLNISRIVKERGMQIYKEALDKDLVRGRSINGMVAGALYAAIRSYNLPRTLGELAKASLRDKKDIARCHRLILRELDPYAPVPNPKHFVPKIASKLDIGMRAQGLTEEILEYLKEIKMTSGKDPKGLAAAALYMACKETDEHRVQKAVADAAGTTEVTLRNRMKDLDDIPIYELAQKYKM